MRERFLVTLWQCFELSSSVDSIPRSFASKTPSLAFDSSHLISYCCLKSTTNITVVQQNVSMQYRKLIRVSSEPLEIYNSLHFQNRSATVKCPQQILAERRRRATMITAMTVTEPRILGWFFFFQGLGIILISVTALWLWQRRQRTKAHGGTNTGRKRVQTLCNWITVYIVGDNNR